MNYKILSPFKSAVYLVLLSTVIYSGCSKEHFAERNTDPVRLAVLNADDIKGIFPGTLYAGVNTGPDVDYQQAQNLFADMYCQYFAGTQTAFASHRYVIQQLFARYQWISTYKAAAGLQAIIKTPEDPKTVNLKAIAKIWKVFVFHRTTDYFGPIPYTQIGGSDSSLYVPYDDQKTIYYQFFDDLSAAISDLKSTANTAQASYEDKDVLYQGDINKWLAFANTLRLRLAMRISGVDPEKARAEAEAAVAEGVMTDVAQDGYMQPISPDDYNGLARIASWNEFRMSTSMESILKGYDDPRLSKFFQPALSDGQYRGVRNGMIPAEQTLPQNDYNQASNLNQRMTADSMFSTPIPVMYSAEAYFLRAEGVLNGWNMGGGTAAEFYAKGIENSMRTWGINDATTINNYINSTNVPIAPGGFFHTAALTDIPVKFSSDPAKQLEQIQTQKWLGVFPDGYEAWAEMRRTGYPKFYPLIHSENPNVPADQMIRRIPFTDLDKSTNGPAVEEAKTLLNGPDNAATHLWWDVK